jgi:hypothetical protein
MGAKDSNKQKIKVPAGHVLLTGGNPEVGGDTIRFLETSTGQVRLSDGSLAPAGEQLRPADSAVDRDRDQALSDYAYNEHLRSMLAASGKRSMSAPAGFRVLSEREGFSTSQLGVATTGTRKVLMDMGVGDVHIDAALPNYAAGYRLGEAVADIVSAPVISAKASNYYMTWDDVNSFRRVTPNAGAPGGNVPEISVSKTNALYATVPYALGGFMPTEVETNADAPLRPFQKLVRRVMEALYLEREIRVATQLTTSGSWDSAHVTTVAAGAKWNGGASADPIRNLRNLIELSALEPTGIIMSRAVYNIFSESPAVQKFFAYKDSGAPLPNAAQMSALLDLPPIYIAKMKYYASGTTFSYVWGNDVVLFRQPGEMPPTSQDDVSTAATFRWLGGDAPDGTQQGGWNVRTFYLADRGPRGGRKVVVAHNDDEVVTSNITGGLIKNAVQ